MVEAISVVLMLVVSVNNKPTYIARCKFAELVGMVR